jgi:putative Holliday junction resolvase
VSLPASCVLGFDVGARRIGVAIGNTLTDSARDLQVVAMHEQQPDWIAIDKLIAEWRPDLLLVGDPATLDGGDQPARQRARAFARLLRKRYGLSVELVDERSSSVEAAHQFARERAGGTRRRRDAGRLDAMAAAVIVRRWLDDPSLATSHAVPPPAASEGSAR